MSQFCLNPLGLAALLLLAPSVQALNQKNAGPTEVEIKFKLPAPAPLSPEEALKSFQVEEGLKIELVAAEPMIEAPIAISFDHLGGLYVVEMRGYMRDLKGSTENEPLGRIRYLTDSDGDGRMDKAVTFLDKLVMPRSVMAVNGGALVAAPPELLFCRDTNGDGIADTKEVMANDFGSITGQPEHMANSPTWMMDNAVWCANYSTRFKWRSGQWLKDSGLGRGQWGLCQDNVGRLYYNYNSDLLRCDLLPNEAFTRHPLYRAAKSINFQVVKDQSVFPIHQTPGVNRGYSEGTLRADGTLAKTTAVSAPIIYRGYALPAAYANNAFVPEPAGNLIKRLILEEKDGIVTGRHALEGKEFMASTDERFRPVQLSNGPDGALYVVDMYRGIIQHSGFLTHYLEANIQDRKLELPFDRGRIWRITGQTSPRPNRTIISAKVSEQVELLSHANGWVRDTAQRLIVESAAPEAAELLTKLVTNLSASPLARLHALWSFDGLMALTPEVFAVVLKDPDASVRAAAVRLATKDLQSEVIAATQDLDVRVRAQAALWLSSTPNPESDAALAKLLASPNGQGQLVTEAAITGTRGRELSLLNALAKAARSPDLAKGLSGIVGTLSELVLAANKSQPIEQLLELAASAEAHPEVKSSILRSFAPASKQATTKLVWFEREPKVLGEIVAQIAAKVIKVKPEQVSSRLAWPGKPGAPEPPKVAPLTPDQMALSEKGKSLFTLHCATCHQPHGYGLDGLAPPLVDSEWLLGSPDIPVKIIMQGIAGPIKVGNRTWNLAMPPLAHLQNEDVAAILTYLRREWEHTASPVDVSLVAKLREEHKSRFAPWTAQELRSKGKKATN